MCWCNNSGSQRMWKKVPKRDLWQQRITVLHTDLWQSHQFRISRHRMHLCKQVEAAHMGWQLEEDIGIMKIYIHWCPCSYSLGVSWAVQRFREWLASGWQVRRGAAAHSRTQLRTFHQGRRKTLNMVPHN